MKRNQHSSLLAQVLRLENLSVIEQFTAYPPPKSKNTRRYWQHLLKLGIITASITIALVLLGWVAIQL